MSEELLGNGRRRRREREQEEAEEGGRRKEERKEGRTDGGALEGKRDRSVLESLESSGWTLA